MADTVVQQNLTHHCKVTMKSQSVGHSVVSDSLWPHELEHASFLCPWDCPCKNTGVGCHSLLQGIFPTQGSNPSLLHCRQILYCLNHQGSNYTPIKKKRIDFLHFSFRMNILSLHWTFSQIKALWMILEGSGLPIKKRMGTSLVCQWLRIHLVVQMVKHLPTMWETQVRFLGWEVPLEKEMATHSSTLAWKSPWMEEHGWLKSMGL